MDGEARAAAGLALLRLAAGGFLLPHGLGKLFSALGPGLAGFRAELRGLGLPAGGPLPALLALAQAGSGLFVLIGWQTRPAALFAAAFIATTVVLARDNGWYWMHRGVEYPLFWLLALLALALLGPGAWSLDTQLGAPPA
ncbi:DoxX family membrane protein [Tahibacter sp.]|uniref:DoxX family membrane protein n=1 Tax=Tahibacter sp. TaxID=2056211 RepID=UPI0028C41F9F|nr:DoxX family membrane protein [Tahibacter sp.]